jgi:hypothetical protein
MRTFIVLTLSAIVAGSTTWEDLATKPYSYTDYTAEFGKKASADRQAIFETTLAEIIAHNQDHQWTYKKGVNQFTDMTKAEFKAYYAGYKKVGLQYYMFCHVLTLSQTPRTTYLPRTSMPSLMYAVGLRPPTHLSTFL